MKKEKIIIIVLGAICVLFILATGIMFNQMRYISSVRFEYQDLYYKKCEEFENLSNKMNETNEQLTKMYNNDSYKLTWSNEGKTYNYQNTKGKIFNNVTKTVIQ